MAKEIYLFPIQLHNINAVRRIRTHFAISAQQLSIGIGKSINYIGTIENEQVEGSYDDEILTKIAAYINTLIANDPTLQLEDEGKNKYTIYDFYPLEILSEERVLKRIEAIPLDYSPTGTLNALIESTDFFKHKRVLKEIVEKANEVQNKNWKGNNFTQPLEYAVKNNRLKLEIIDGLNHYSLLK